MRTDPTFEATVGEAELRRWIRHVSVLLATSEPDVPERYQLLRRARHWTASVLNGIEQLLQVEEQRLGIPDTVDDPLTAGIVAETIERSR
jgi:hypothetical protein